MRALAQAHECMHGSVCVHHGSRNVSTCVHVLDVRACEQAGECAGVGVPTLAVCMHVPVHVCTHTQERARMQLCSHVSLAIYDPFFSPQDPPGACTEGHTRSSPQLRSQASPKYVSPPPRAPLQGRAHPMH